MVGSVLLLGYPYTITERRSVQHLKGGSNIMSKTNGLNSLSKYALRDTSKNVMMLALGCTYTYFGSRTRIRYLPDIFLGRG